MPKYDNFELDLQTTKETLNVNYAARVTSNNSCYTSKPVTTEFINCDCL